MSKDWLSRAVYLVLFVVGVIFLAQGHIKHSAENSILGAALLGASLFFAHWPLSWKH